MKNNARFAFLVLALVLGAGLSAQQPIPDLDWPPVFSVANNGVVWPFSGAHILGDPVTAYDVTQFGFVSSDDVTSSSEGADIIVDDYGPGWDGDRDIYVQFSVSRAPGVMQLSSGPHVCQGPIGCANEYFTYLQQTSTGVPQLYLEGMIPGTPAPGEDMDALQWFGDVYPLFFTVSPETALRMSLEQDPSKPKLYSASTIFGISGPGMPPVPVLTSANLGLIGPTIGQTSPLTILDPGDEIDGLMVDLENTKLAYSLKAGSPSLGNWGVSPSELFIYDPNAGTGGPTPIFTNPGGGSTSVGSLGLPSGVDVNAIRGGDPVNLRATAGSIAQGYHNNSVTMTGDPTNYHTVLIDNDHVGGPCREWRINPGSFVNLNIRLTTQTPGAPNYDPYATGTGDCVVIGWPEKLANSENTTIFGLEWPGDPANAVELYNSYLGVLPPAPCYLRFENPASQEFWMTWTISTIVAEGGTAVRGNDVVLHFAPIGFDTPFPAPILP